MKFPTEEEFAQMVADKAIDGIEYNGKTLREWIEIIAATELSTNLAEVGTDCISRQAAIKAIDECYCGGEDSRGEPWIYKENAVEAIQMIEPIPPAEPQIIRCKDCNHWTKQKDSLQGRCALIGMGIYPTSNWFCGNAERRTE